jgi:hypothetical protein
MVLVLARPMGAEAVPARIAAVNYARALLERHGVAACNVVPVDGRILLRRLELQA